MAGSIGDMFVRLGVINDDLTKGLRNSEGKVKTFAQKLESFGHNMKKVGMDLTKGLTVPITGIAVAAFRSSEQASSYFSKFTAKTKQAFGKLGDEIASSMQLDKVLGGLSSIIDKVVKSFTNLSPGMKQFVVYSAATLASLGPLLLVFDKLIQVVAKFGAVLKFLFISPVGAVVTIVASLTAAILYATGAFAAIERKLTGTTSILKDQEAAAKAMRQEWEAMVRVMEKYGKQRHLFDVDMPSSKPTFGEPVELPSWWMDRPKFLTPPTPPTPPPKSEARWDFSRQAIAQAEYQRKLAEYDIEMNKFRQSMEATMLGGKRLGNILVEVYQRIGDAIPNLSMRWQRAMKDNPLTKAIDEANIKRREMVEASIADAEEIKAAYELMGGGFNALAAQTQRATQMYQELLRSGVDPTTEGMVKLRQGIESLQTPWMQFVGMLMTTTNYAQQLAQTMYDAVTGIAAGIGNAFAQVIVYGEDMGKILVAMMKQIAAGIISSLIQIGIMYVINSVIKLGAYLVEAIAAMKTYAAITYAAAFASTAAIPIIGPWAAPGVAKGAVAAMLTGAGAAATAGVAVGAAIGGAESGGIFTHPGLTRIAERGKPELVLNEGNIRRFFPGMVGGRGGPIHIQLYLDKRGKRLLTQTVVDDAGDYLRYRGV